jgi:hypothetical protein
MNLFRDNYHVEFLLRSSIHVRNLFLEKKASNEEGKLWDSYNQSWSSSILCSRKWSFLLRIRENRKLRKLINKWEFYRVIGALMAWGEERMLNSDDFNGGFYWDWWGFIKLISSNYKTECLQRRRCQKTCFFDRWSFKFCWLFRLNIAEVA